MLECKLEALGDGRAGGGGAVGLRRVDRVDPADVVEVEPPQLDGGRGEQAPGEELLDALEEVVGKFELAVFDPLSGLE